MSPLGHWRTPKKSSRHRFTPIVDIRHLVGMSALPGFVVTPSQENLAAVYLELPIGLEIAYANYHLCLRVVE